MVLLALFIEVIAKNTNNLRTSITNNLNFRSKEFILNNGLKIILILF